MLLLLLACVSRLKDDTDGASPTDATQGDDSGGITWATGTLALHLIDVGQGDGMLVIGPSGRTMVVDIGDEDAWWDHTEDYLAAHAPQGVNLTVVSHLHSDHLGAMDRLLDAHPETEAAYDNGRGYDSSDYDWYVRQAGDRRRAVATGDELPFDDAVTVEVLHSDAGDWDNENNNSIVLKLTFGAVTVLLGGDCESTVCENGLRPGTIDVFKVHHHGSSDSNDRALVMEMSPSYALIPVGQRNDYGHPHEETLDTLEAAGAEVWRSDLHGDIVMVTDGQSISVVGSR